MFFFAPRTTVFPLPPPFNRVCTKQLDPVHFEYVFFCEDITSGLKGLSLGLILGHELTFPSRVSYNLSWEPFRAAMTAGQSLLCFCLKSAKQNICRIKIAHVWRSQSDTQLCQCHWKLWACSVWVVIPLAERSLQELTRTSNKLALLWNLDRYLQNCILFSPIFAATCLNSFWTSEPCKLWSCRRTQRAKWRIPGIIPKLSILRLGRPHPKNISQTMSWDWEKSPGIFVS